MKSAEYWINHLEMEAHPEGGYYKEAYRNPSTIQIMEQGGTRNLATSIYFLLRHNDKSHFHQLKSDEIWYYHEGRPVVVHLLENGEYRKAVLGKDPENGESFQLLIPRGSIFAAEVLNASEGDYTLMGCMVNPGFDFKDFRMVDAAELTGQYPDHLDLIQQFTTN